MGNIERPDDPLEHIRICSFKNTHAHAHTDHIRDTYVFVNKLMSSNNQNGDAILLTQLHHHIPIALSSSLFVGGPCMVLPIKGALLPPSHLSIDLMVNHTKNISHTHIKSITVQNSLFR